MATRALSIAFALVVTSACAGDAGGPTEAELLTVPVFEGAGASEAAAAEAANFRAHAHGGEEVPPVDTRAQGQATFRLDGDAIRYRLIVANIENVTQSHIHLAPAGQNGPVVVWLYPSGPPAQLIPGRTQGVLAEGEIGEEDLVGPLAGMELDDLLEALRGGNAYVNVHTSAHPPGEIRGQIH